MEVPDVTETSVHRDAELEEIANMLNASNLDVTLPESRPPSYNSLSLGKQAAEESARRAAKMREAGTDTKRIVSAGDVPEVDCCDVKTPPPGFSDDDEDGEEGDECNRVSPEIANMMRAIRELQEQQDQLRRMQEEHDKKWQDFLSHQPQVNDQLQVIRKNSIKKRGQRNRECVVGTLGHASGANKTGNNSYAVKDNTTNNSGYGRQIDDMYVNTTYEPGCDVAQRRPTKNACRNARAEDGVQNFQKLFLRERQQQSVYVQLECLYHNLHRLHLPLKTMRDVMGGTGLHAAPFTPANNICMGVVPDTPPGELENLKLENEELQRQNKDLQEKLKNALDEKAPPARGRRPPRARRPPPLPPKPNARAHENQDRPSTTDISVQNSFADARKRSFVAGRPTSPPRPHLRSKEIFFKCITVDYKIINYWEKRREEQVRPGSKQISSPFYTAHGGYRVQLEVFLNGNGLGRGKCMSVFVRVIQGENDSFLQWPININLQVKLLDQTGDSSYTVESKGNQFWFKQPLGTSESETDSWGLKEFVSHNDVTHAGYLKEGAIKLCFKLRFDNGNEG